MPEWITLENVNKIRSHHSSSRHKVPIWLKKTCDKAGTKSYWYKAYAGQATDWASRPRIYSRLDIDVLDGTGRRRLASSALMRRLAAAEGRP